MHNIAKSSVPILAMILLVACRKDEPAASPAPSDPPALTISDYSLLHDGNFWVYERLYLDSEGNWTGTTPLIDSLIVDGDSLIDGIVWKVMRSTSGGVFDPVSFRRDSANYLLQLGHGRLFAITDTDLVLWQEHFANIIDVNYE